MYQVIDSGCGRKLEQFEDYIIDRPCAQAFWPKVLDETIWQRAMAIFQRENESCWQYKGSIKDTFITKYFKYNFRIKFTDFGHIGLFPEHKKTWELIEEHTTSSDNILNLFGYTGGATIAALSKGANVTHVDSSQKINDQAKENIKLNGLDLKKVRWITDDVLKFLKREQKRNNSYSGIILDPPTFGRGTKGEVFKIEKDINRLLQLILAVSSKALKYIIFTCHTPGFTGKVLENLLAFHTKGLNGKIFSGELLIESNTFSIPSGSISYFVKK